jgi:hypothetical protein
VNATHVSLTDPEATLARGGSGPSQPSYKHHRAVDDAQGVITAVKTTTGQVGDAGQLAGLVEQHGRNTGEPVKVVVGDKHYGSAENYRYCQSRQITTHLGQAEASARKIYPASAFVYDAEQDRYRCPAGHHLYYHNYKKEDQLVEYRIEQATLCAACPLRVQCTEAEKGRTVTRPIFSELVYAGQNQAHSPEGRISRTRRQHLSEGSFADASNNHGFKRARWRGLWRQQIQDWLIAAAQNLRILMRKGGHRATGATATALWVLKTLVALTWSLEFLLSRIFAKAASPFFTASLSPAQTQINPKYAI